MGDIASLPKQTVKYFGWKPQKPDPRDREFTFKRKAIRLPAKVWLDPNCMPKVWDQGELGSCVGWSTGGALAFLRAKQGERWFTPSARFIYYNARVIEGTIKEDAGCEIRDGIKGVSKLGVSPHEFCAYNIKYFARKPGNHAYDAARTDILDSYQRIDNRRLNDLKAALAQGFPIVFGFSVFDSFDDIGKDGFMPVPKSSEQMNGGHAVWAWAYDDKKNVLGQRGAFLIRNSWAYDWGHKGNFWMPYSIITDPNMASDFWAVKHVT